MKKRIRILLSVFISAVFLFCIPLTVFAAEGNTGTTPDGFSWEELGDGTLAITGYTGSETDLTIPGSIDGKSVTSIGVQEHAGSLNGQAFTNVNIPDGVVRICASAFQDCTSLASVRFPGSVQYIDFLAFSGCSSLASLSLPAELLSIGQNTFAGTGISEVTVPEKANYFGPGSFNCSGLVKITVLNQTAQFDGDVFGSAPLTTGIFGYSGSTAETYAAANSINFSPLYVEGTVSDPSTGVEVSGPLPNGSTLEVNEIPSGSEIYQQALQSLGGNKMLFLLDLSLMQGEAMVQPNGNVTVTIPLPDEYKNAPNLVVAYIDDGGAVTYIDATVQDGKISFVTNHFSSYAVVQRTTTSGSGTETETETQLDAIPKTGEGNTDTLWWLLAVLSGMGMVAFALMYRKWHGSARG